jgi:hypothetical protein
MIQEEAKEERDVPGCTKVNLVTRCGDAEAVEGMDKAL